MTSRSELITRAQTIRAESVKNANTPERVGSWCEDMANSAAFKDLEGTTYADMVSLQAVAPTNDALAVTLGYSTSGDGGGGQWLGVTSAAPGTYTHNGGTVLVISGGDGSAAWVREWSGPVRAAWFGASSSATATVNTAALVAAQAVGLTELEPNVALEINGTISVTSGFIGDNSSISQTSDTSIFTATSKSNLVFRGLVLKHTSGTKSVTSHGITVASSSAVIVERCTFDGWRGDGVKFDSVTASAVKDCAFRNAYPLAVGENINLIQHDVYLTGSCQKVTVSGIKSDSGTGTSVAVLPTLASDRAREILIDDCQISGCRTYGILVYTSTVSDDPPNAIAEVTISNCVISDIKGDLQTADYYFGDGIYLQGDVRVIFDSCRVYNCCQSTVIDSTLTAGCIGINGARNVEMSNCEVSVCKFHGIDMVAASYTESYNIDGGTTVRSVDGVGIKLRASDANSARVTIAGSTVTGVGSFGVLGNITTGGYEVDTLNLCDCQIVGVGNVVTGVQTDRINNVRVSGCTISNFGNYGYYANNVAQAVVHDNAVTGCLVGLGSDAASVVTHYSNRVTGTTNPLIFNVSAQHQFAGQYKINTQSAGYDLALTDMVNMGDPRTPLVVMENAAPANVNVRLHGAGRPFVAGGSILVRRRGVGTATFLAEGGVTINAPDGLTFTKTHQTARLTMVAIDEWDLEYLS